MKQKHNYVRNTERPFALVTYVKNGGLSYNPYKRVLFASWDRPSFVCVKREQFSGISEFLRDVYKSRYYKYNIIIEHAIYGHGNESESVIHFINEKFKRKNEYDDYNSWSYAYHHGWEYRYAYIFVYNDTGEIVNPDYIRTKLNDFTFEEVNIRGGRRGSKRNYRSSYYRNMHTMQEIRENDNVDDDLEEYLSEHQRNKLVRACRNNLPNSWDDISYARQPNRSWKMYRDTQYKEKKK